MKIPSTLLSALSCGVSSISPLPPLSSSSRRRNRSNLDNVEKYSLGPKLTEKMF
jgi:hypothetical protein